MTRIGKTSRWQWWVLGCAVGLCPVALVAYLIVHGTEPVKAEEPRHGAHGAAGEHSGIRVDVVRPHKGEMDRTTTQPGTVQAFESVQIYAGVSGYLKSLEVDIGDRIVKGHTLATVDVPELVKEVDRRVAAVEQAVARVAQMNAHVESAKANLEAARSAVPQAEATAKSKAAEMRFRSKQLRRMRDLYALKSIDEKLVDESMEKEDAAREAQIAAEEGVTAAKAKLAAEAAHVLAAVADVAEAKAEVNSAKAEKERAEVFVKFATITAPFNGVVTERNVFPGDYVKSASEGAHAPLLTVQRTDRMRVVVQIPDRDVPFCDPGDTATVEIDALPGVKLPAKVARVGHSEDPETRLMHVEIDLPNPTGKLVHGMYGRVTILLQKSDLFALPASSVLGKTQDGKGKVFIVRDGKVRLVPVMIASDNGVQVGIASGVAAEDQVVLHPSSELTDGTPVETH